MLRPLYALILPFLACTDLIGLVQDGPAALWIEPNAAVVHPGERIELEAWGRETELGSTIRFDDAGWVSSAPAVATISNDGVLTGHSSGVTTITVTVDGREESALVAIRSSGREPSMRWASVDVGDASVCAISTEDQLYCWGSDYWGQLGRGTRSGFGSTLAPVEVHTSARFTRISVGGSHTCGVTTDSGVLCWGENSVGQLGIGEYSSPVTRPTPVSSNFRGRDVAVSASSSCAIDLDHRRHCWGSNIAGQLGLGDIGVEGYRVGPVAGPEDHEYIDVDAGTAAWHACGRTSNGAHLCWGSNALGETGTGSAASHVVRPSEVSTALRFHEFEAGGGKTCGIAENGRTYCWGGPGWLILGREAPSAVRRPEPITSALRFIELAVDDSVCGLTADGSAYCWGLNGAGQLGTEASTETCSSAEIPCSSDPLPVTGGLTFSNISTGGRTTCGITDDRALYCWGSNRYGNLGGGRPAESSFEPVRVADPVG